MSFEENHIMKRRGTEDPKVQASAHVKICRAKKQGVLVPKPCCVCNDHSVRYTPSSYYDPVTKGRWLCSHHLLRYRKLLEVLGIVIPGSPKPVPRTEPFKKRGAIPLDPVTGKAMRIKKEETMTIKEHSDNIREMRRRHLEKQKPISQATNFFRR